MATEDVRQERDDVKREWGDWNAYNLRLADGVYTMRDSPNTNADLRVRRCLQTVADLHRLPFSEQRVLDLGCLEGLFALEFAAKGASCLGIDGRRASVEKARFAASKLGLEDRCQFEVEDARRVDPATTGTFDVVLCLGLLYHLDRQDQLPFLRTLRNCCTGILLMETHVSAAPKVALTDGGQSYSGRWYREHDDGASTVQRMKVLRASLDNSQSYWFTYPSLVNALHDVGFTSVVEVPMPPAASKTTDRKLIAALAGEAQAPVLSTLIDDDIARLPERDPRHLHRSQDPAHQARLLASRIVPQKLRNAVRPGSSR